MGVSYYANYLVWFEVGRTDFLRALGSTYRDLEAAGIFMPVIEVHCEYRQPTRYDDALEIRTRGSLLSPLRIQFAYDVVRLDGVLAATGHTIHASVDPSGRPIRLPKAVQTLFTCARS
jgi:acyl-CoA thioester hydrolase